MRRVVVALIIAGTVVSGCHRAPPIGPASPSPSGVVEESGTAAPQDPVQILARNIEAAHSACAGCGGQLNVDETTKTQLVDELVAEHSQHDGPALTRRNAELALYGPPGSRPVLAGKNNPPPDVSFRDQAGNEVYRREVKTYDGNSTTFSKNVSDWADKLKYRGELFIQVPAGTDPRPLMDGFWNARRDDRLLTKYADLYAVFHDPDGQVIGIWMFGARGMGVPG
jgi:hypothetical protein